MQSASPPHYETSPNFLLSYNDLIFIFNLDGNSLTCIVLKFILTNPTTRTNPVH